LARFEIGEKTVMFKGLGNLAGLMKQAQQISGRMQSLNEELKGRRATGSAGGGMVEIDVNGLGEVLACRIDAALVEQKDRELLEDLITAAVNQALAKAKQLHAEAMRDLAGGIELPGLEEAIAKLTGGGGPSPDKE
jgi:DNA-binding YbaB/EbfC family protein